MNNGNDLIIDKVWQELDRQLPRETIGRTVTEISLAYQDAKVQAFVPMFVYRQAVERLKRQLNEKPLSANGRVSFVDGQWPGHELAPATQINH